MLGQIVEDRYLVEAELGEGAMGRVYRARHIKVGRQVAIKVMHAELARVPTIVERFAREARIAARLAHPNVVSVLDVGVTPGPERLPLIVLELAAGRSLVDLALEPMPRERVVNMIHQLLRGLDHAHSAGLVHRDLKPDNILVETLADGTDVPRIVDFGIAVCSRGDDPIAGRRLTEANTVIGTPCYMSPEQAMAKELDARTDLFSLGVIMYELLAGTPPFPGSGLEIAYANASKDVPSIAERAGIMVDPLLEVFLRKLLARRLSERFQTAREALLMLELIETDRIAAARALSGVAPSVTPVSLAARGSSRQSNALPSDSDSRATHPAAAAVAVPAAPRARAASEITHVEHVVGMRPGRKRAWMGAGLAAAALTAIVGWSAGTGHDGPAPRIESSLAASQSHAPAPTLSPPTISTLTVTPLSPPTAPSMIRIADEPAITSARTATPGPLHVGDAEPASKAMAVRAKRAAKAAGPAAPVAATAPAAPAMPTSPIAAPSTTIAVDGIEATQATAHVAAQTDSQDLAARYLAVGRALRGGRDELWARYRMIRINEALASDASRKQALFTLAEIERAIQN